MIRKVLLYSYGITAPRPVSAKLKRFIVVEHIHRSEGDYNLYFVYKPRGKNSLELLSRLERASKDRVSIAGIKDTAADAFFYVASRNRLPKMLGGAKLYFIGKNAPLSPANNKGNTFRLSMSTGLIGKDKVKRLCRLPRVFYMPNYYGPQRFGLVRPVNHVMGKQVLLQRNVLLWLYLKSYYRRKAHFPPPMEQSMFGKARRTFNVNPAFPSRVFDLVRESYYSYLFNLILSQAGLPPGIYTRQERIPLDILDEASSWCGNSIVRTYRLKHNLASHYIGEIESFEGLHPRAGLLDRRPVIVPLCNYLCKESNGEVILTFRLPSGSYATTFLLNMGIIVE